MSNEQQEQHTLAIKSNNCATNDPCAICGARTDPAIGPELFLSASMDVVCHGCGVEHAPDLMAMMLSWRYTTGTILAACDKLGDDDGDDTMFLVYGTGATSVGDDYPWATPEKE